MSLSDELMDGVPAYEMSPMWPTLTFRVGRIGSADQARAVEQIAASGRSLDLLVGPAGTGKSTSMLACGAVWE